MRVFITAVALLLASAGATRAQAPPVDATQSAKALYDAGVRQYNLSEFPKALDDFKAAYELRPDPALLFNIGQCHRALGHAKDAVLAYRAYLRELPDAPNRAEVERWRADLEEQMQRNPTAATPAPESGAATATSPPVATPAATPAAMPAAATATTPSTAPAIAESPRAPLYKRWWLWTAVGAVALVAVGVGVGVAAAPGKDAPNPGGTAGSMVVRF